MKCTRSAFLLIFSVVIAGCNNEAPGRKLKAFVAGLSAENHTGAPFYTSLSDFEDLQGLRDLYREAAERRGWDIATGKFLGASPANRVLGPAYETIKAELLADLKAAMPAFNLENTSGETVSSADLLAKGPLVVSFFRGKW